MLHWCLEAPPETERVWGGLCSVTLRAMPRMATLHPELEARIFREGIEAGAVLVDIGQVAVAEDPGIGVCGLQFF